MNLIILQGVIRDEPDVRTLPSGEQATSLELTVATSRGGAEIAPVVIYGRAPKLAAGGEVVVVGRVRKRFYRAGRQTKARTEVVATKVVPARQALRVGRVFAEAADELRRAGAI